MKHHVVTTFLVAVLAIVFVSCACTRQESKPVETRDPFVNNPDPVVHVVSPVPVSTTGMTDPPPPPPPYTPCKADMVEIKGSYCPGLKETCAEWMAPDDHFRCKRFAKSVCVGGTVEKHFCIDKYEYPNKPGVTPQTYMLWGEAQNMCVAQGKRLCLASEWTFACQGRNWKPYPYGTERDSTACRIDLGLETPGWAKGRELGYPTTPAPLQGMVSVNFSKPSGEYARCVSDFGVHDLTGNVDEWVTSDVGDASWLKGGWWGNVRNRCGPDAVTTGHDKVYAGIQVGFRCCSNVSK